MTDCIHSAIAPNMDRCIKCGQVWTGEGWTNPPAAAPEGAPAADPVGEIVGEFRDVGGYTPIIRWDCSGEHPDVGTKLYTAPPSLDAEDVALREDAERYRLLRERRAVALLTAFFGNGCINRTIAEVDEAIDAARAAEGNGHG